MSLTIDIHDLPDEFPIEDLQTIIDHVDATLTKGQLPGLEDLVIVESLSNEPTCATIMEHDDVGNLSAVMECGAYKMAVFKKRHCTLSEIALEAALNKGAVKCLDHLITTGAVELNEALAKLGRMNYSTDPDDERRKRVIAGLSLLRKIENLPIIDPSKMEDFGFGIMSVVQMAKSDAPSLQKLSEKVKSVVSKNNDLKKNLISAYQMTPSIRRDGDGEVLGWLRGVVGDSALQASLFPDSENVRFANTRKGNLGMEIVALNKGNGGNYVECPQLWKAAMITLDVSGALKQMVDMGMRDDPEKWPTVLLTFKEKTANPGRKIWNLWMNSKMARRVITKDNIERLKEDLTISRHLFPEAAQQVMDECLVVADELKNGKIRDEWEQPSWDGPECLDISRTMKVESISPLSGALLAGDIQSPGDKAVLDCLKNCEALGIDPLAALSQARALFRTPSEDPEVKAWREERILRKEARESSASKMKRKL